MGNQDNTIGLILALIPVVEKLGIALIDLIDTDYEVDKMTLSEIREMLEETRVENWEDFKFESSKK